MGSGLRLDAVGVGAPNVLGTIHATMQDNLLVNNRFGLIVHAAFPVNNTNRKGNVDLTLGRNVFARSCQTDLLVSLSRHTTALGLTNAPWLLNSTFEIALRANLDWDDVWFGHADGFGNTLVVDGETIAPGTRHFYDAAGCPGLAAAPVAGNP